jgi:AcrR family transcriptional regulator
MPPGRPLDAETILAATEQVLRRHGPAKATVVDVARALGVSHAAVYKHFASKTALREAVTTRWLEQTLPRLEAVARDVRLAPPDRLRAWFMEQLAVKQDRVAEDPELFATYRALAAEHSDVAAQHVRDLLAQVGSIIADGVAGGDLAAADPAQAARAVFQATMAFHHPALADSWTSPGAAAALDETCTLLLDGLRAPRLPATSVD